jgi:hypothetical protein
MCCAVCQMPRAVLQIALIAFWVFGFRFPKQMKVLVRSIHVQMHGEPNL